MSFQLISKWCEVGKEYSIACAKAQNQEKIHVQDLKEVHVARLKGKGN